MKYNFTHLGAVLNKYKILYVPYYQREYVWGTENDGQNLYKFIDDIFTSYDEHPEQDYLIGTLAFCSIKVNDIIDGQQRLTSLILILSRLAEIYCSDDIKEEHMKLLYPKQDDTFIIQEENYLTEEIKYVLGLPNNYNTQGHSVSLSDTITRIDKQMENAWSGYNENWYDGLYQYILDKIKFASFEYNNLGDALKYFLNNNSLSIPLTNVEIFYSIFSQSIREGKTLYNIFDIKEKLKNMADQSGIKVKFNQYKKYDKDSENGVANIIYIFLKTYYQNDPNILRLEGVGVGRWLSLYKNEVFKDPIEANKFVETFMKYIVDFETLYNQFTNNNVNLDPASSLYISWVLLRYENYKDILNVLIEIFKSKHNYINESLYMPDNSIIDIVKLNELAKRLNLTVLKQYSNKSNDRISGYPTNIKTEKDKYVNSINDLVNNISYDTYLSLTYKRDARSNEKINDDSRLIKVIFACQEAFLDVTADSTKTFGEYLDNLLSTNQFSVEHLYSIKEWDEISRRINWQQKKNKFNTESDFDIERFKFLNLSLLNTSANSTAGSKVIYDKLSDYKQARKIFNSKPEYLIQSFVDDSAYYKNPDIQALGLPERKITNIDQNTWEHSPNNRQFNIKLIELAIKYIANI